MSDRSSAWSNPSVLAFAGGADPLLKAREVAAQLVSVARARNLQGPPVDVLALARAAGIHVRAVNEVADARIVAEPLDDHNPETPESTKDFAPFPDGTSGLTIDYNPSRPRGRLRFSIAHELAHACFPGVGEQVRHRTSSGAVPDTEDGDNWELELLCNVIASELLLPDDAVAGLLNIATDIDFIMETRRRWDVSIEALLRRLTHATARALTMVAVSRVGGAEKIARLDYADHSGATPPTSALRSLAHGQLLPGAPLFLDCVAVGQTVRGEVQIGGEPFAAQAVGAPPYPGGRFPRVLALLEEPDQLDVHPEITYVTGDLLDLDAGTQPVLIAHVVSDASHAWGRLNVGAALSRAFPDAARAFRAWTIADAENLRLGRVHALDQTLNGREVTIASMVAQAGFGPGAAVRLRYDALAECLETVADLAVYRGAHLHVPRIGAGQAGGRWDVIADLINTHVAGRGVPVTVHTKPGPQSNMSRAG
ncbi:ImmA/IrrE family metallo-endopeptidase [Mycobacterium sp. 050272]|uniref:ImmA/IrrE family metallo-endopeptidase n=1 Tax=Mycobacterium sp. 050272 TaxID=3142488 RepID=UPI00318AD1DE